MLGARLSHTVQPLVKAERISFTKVTLQMLADRALRVVPRILCSVVHTLVFEKRFPVGGITINGGFDGGERKHRRRSLLPLE